MAITEFHKLHFPTATEQKLSWDNCGRDGKVPGQSTAEGVESGYLQLIMAEAAQHFHLIYVNSL